MKFIHLLLSNLIGQNVQASIYWYLAKSSLCIQGESRQCVVICVTTAGQYIYIIFP